MPQELEAHPLYDHQNDHFRRPVDCPDPLCLRIDKDSTICFKCPEGRRESYGPPRSGWGGRRAGAGAPKGSLNHLKTGNRSALIRRAVDVLAENKDLRPFLLLIARAAVEGEIPQTTRRLILHSLGKTTTGMQAASSQLRRLRLARHFRLYHRLKREFRDIEADSPQDACEEIGWSFDDTWIREETRGKYSNGWKNVTRRLRDGKTAR